MNCQKRSYFCLLQLLPFSHPQLSWLCRQMIFSLCFLWDNFLNLLMMVIRRLFARYKTKKYKVFTAFSCGLGVVWLIARRLRWNWKVLPVFLTVVWKNEVLGGCIVFQWFCQLMSQNFHVFGQWTLPLVLMSYLQNQIQHENLGYDKENRFSVRCLNLP